VTVLVKAVLLYCLTCVCICMFLTLNTGWCIYLCLCVIYLCVSLCVCLSVCLCYQKAMCRSLQLASEPTVVPSSRTDRGVHALCSSLHVDLHHQLVSLSISHSLFLFITDPFFHTYFRSHSSKLRTHHLTRLPQLEVAT